MATNKSKGNKKKRQTMTWQEFVRDAPSMPTVTISWADEMDSQNADEREMLVYVNRAALPTAPRAVDESKVPTQPPFQAYIGDLPFNISEDDIRRFFKPLKVKNIKLQTDNVGRLRFFGYVEFETRQMLIEALSLTESIIKNRAVRVDLVTQNYDFHLNQRDGGEDRTQGNKKKGQTMTWRDFVQYAPSMPTVTSLWFNEMDSQNADSTAPRAVRGANVDESKVPTQAPYQAYIGNLPFDISEDDIRRFFKNLKVNNIKLQSDNAGRFRGFGYVEFETRQMLIDSFSMTGSLIRNRAIRIDLDTLL